MEKALQPINETYVEWANTLDSAGEDSGPARERLDSVSTLAALRANMLDVIKTAVEADKFKKAVFYGKPLAVPSWSGETSELFIAWNNIDDHETIRLFHAILGLVTEAGELMEAFHHQIFNNVPIDKQNVIEEAGDIMWYMAVLAKHCGFTTLNEFMATNKAKLTARYGTTWTQDGALNRDTGNEMGRLQSILDEQMDSSQELQSLVTGSDPDNELTELGKALDLDKEI